MLPSAMGSEGLISSISRNLFLYKKFEYVSMQYSSTSSRMFYTNLSYRFTQNIAQTETRKLWNAQLDTDAAICPYVVFDPESKQNMVMVQDQQNTLYLYDNSGKMRWYKKLGSRIISQIYEVDAMNNGQRQYLFNSADQVFLIDISGNNMLHYPIRLGGEAIAGLTVLRPDTGHALFFVPCSNQNTYGYSIKGKLLEGWNPRTMEHNVKYGIRSFRLGSRNFLYSSTERGTLYIWSQKGLRVPFNHRKETIFTTPYSYQSIDTSGLRFFALDSAGYIYSYVFGTSADSMKPVYVGKGSFLEARDMNHDGHVEFLTGDKGSYKLFSESGRELSSFNTDDTTSADPFFIEIEGRTKIGIVSPAHNKVYLFHENGSSVSSFPVNGITPFVTSDLYRNGSLYMIVGDRNSYINLYQLK
jgi:hypothetical protein